MAGPYYVDSGASGSNTGADWTNAYTSFWSLPTLASDEIVYVASRHVEADVAATKTLSCPTAGAAAKIYSVGTGGTTYTVGAQVKTTGGSYDILLDGAVEVHGVTFESGRHIQVLCDANEATKLVGCLLKPSKSSAGSIIVAVNHWAFILENCTIDLANDGASTSPPIFDGVGAWDGGIPIKMQGGAITNGGNRSGTNAKIVSNYGFVEMYGVDISSLASACEFVNAGSRLTLVGCKLPATYTVPTTGNVLYEATLHGCWMTSGDTETRVKAAHYTQAGDVNENTAIYLSSGAESDNGNAGTVAFSHKMISGTYCYETAPLTTDWFYVWNDTTGSRNLDIYVGAAETLDDAEVWAEYLYLGTSSSEVLSFATTHRTANAAAATYSTTGGTWTGTGAPTEEYYLRSAVTINEKGWVMGRICVGAASKTVFVDPRIVLS